MKEFLEIGKLVTTHGLKGDLKLQLWCDDADFVSQFEFLYLNNKSKLKVNYVRPFKGDALINFEGYESIDLASSLRGNVIYCKREDIRHQNGAFFISDLIGCRVYDCNSLHFYGTVSDVLNYGASDILEVKKEQKTFLFPFVDEFLYDVDTLNKIIKIKSEGGFFDED